MLTTDNGCNITDGPLCPFCWLWPLRAPSCPPVSLSLAIECDIATLVNAALVAMSNQRNANSGIDRVPLWPPHLTTSTTINQLLFGAARWCSGDGLGRGWSLVLAALCPGGQRWWCIPHSISGGLASVWNVRVRESVMRDAVRSIGDDNSTTNDETNDDMSRVPECDEWPCRTTRSAILVHARSVWLLLVQRLSRTNPCCPTDSAFSSRHIGV